MNKKGITPITIAFWIIMFVIVLFMFGAQFMTYWAGYAVEVNGLTGVEAFLLSNILIWFILIAIVAIMAYLYVGGSNG